MCILIMQELSHRSESTPEAVRSEKRLRSGHGIPQDKKCESQPAVLMDELHTLNHLEHPFLTHYDNDKAHKLQEAKCSSGTSTSVSAC